MTMHDGLLASDPPTANGDGDWLTRQHALALLLLAGTALAFFLCYRMIEPFLAAIAWALALAVVARPVHAWLLERTGKPSVAAGLAVLLVAAVLIVPACFVAHQILREVAVGADFVHTEVQTGRWREKVEQVPALAATLEWAETSIDINEEASRAFGAAAGGIRAFIGASIYTGLHLLLMLLVLFFLFRDHRPALHALRSLVPLSNKETDEVVKRVADTIHATIYGTLVMAVIQGTLGGLIFWFLGLPAPILWGAVMGLLAIVPYLGAFVIWAPAAAYLALQGDWGKATILTVWGAVVIALIDNILYPILVGGRLRMHTLPVFFAMFGGLYVFGSSGIVLGPVVLAITLALVDIWRRRTAGGATAETGVDREAPRVGAEPANRAVSSPAPANPAA
jgi:predicted PurR-regulated permease PerM